VASNSEFYIFRDSRRRAPTSELVEELRAELRELAPAVELDKLNSLLLRAGELECGLYDAQAPPAVCAQASRLTDLFATAALARDSSNAACDDRNLLAAALSILERISYPQSLTVSVPEGFAYYAIHPLDYADLVTRLDLKVTSALVVGVRSIGTTLSAVVAASLRTLGVAASRITVRPTGHPYDRVCEFDAAERRAITESLAVKAEFLICDEGPGRSGSSLLSVAEALEQVGAPRSRIRILCSHQPDVSTLCARDGGRRWLSYSASPAGMTQRLPSGAATCLAGGQWRQGLSADRNGWPAVWPQLERLAYSSADGGMLLTFEGHGHYGQAVHARNQALADAGFAPSYLGHRAGFGRQAAVQGRAARRDDLTPQLLTHMAEYCAWRAREFGLDDVGDSALETMARVNFDREFGVEPEGLVLPVARPTICDGRMMSHEWLLTGDGKWLKLDAGIHGDDHFFPGPCDIAWDLAGITVEWNLGASDREFLLAKYQLASGDDASRRMNPYELAYATFRMAWSRMAAASVGIAEEEGRLMRDYRKYREFLCRLEGCSSERVKEVEVQLQPAGNPAISERTRIFQNAF